MVETIKSTAARLVVTAAIACAADAHAAPCAGFADVDAASAFCPSVAWMKNRSITVGCGYGTNYCPDDAVSRLQIAAFMKRLGEALFPLTCSAGQVMKWNGAAWACANDAPANALVQGGNAFGTAAVVGTLDVQPVEIRSGNRPVVRIVYATGYTPIIVAGHQQNSVAADGYGSVIAGGGTAQGDDGGVGSPNSIDGRFSVIGGGYGNRIGYLAPSGTGYAAIGGGYKNFVDGSAGTVAGGTVNNVRGANGSIGGGYGNRAGDATGLSPYDAIGGGWENITEGYASTVPGGRQNHATGNYSFAAGHRARALADGCFVWSDHSSGDETLCGVANAWVARAKGGFYLLTGGTLAGGYSGAYLPPGSTSWSVVSDRASKRDVRPVDPADVLDRVVRLPIATWTWTAQDPAVRHMGPMAQDFHAAFALGESAAAISTVDADGVALAAIQGLNAKLEARNEALQQEVRALRDALDALRADLARTR